MELHSQHIIKYIRALQHQERAITAQKLGKKNLCISQIGKFYIWDGFFENVVSVKYRGSKVRNDFGFLEMW